LGVGKRSTFASYGTSVGTRYVKNKPKLFEKITQTEKQNKWVNDSKR
jgi:hypothetical protein